METSMLAFLAAPFVASLILTGIHAYLGVHVVERGVIFVDSVARADRGPRRHRRAAHAAVERRSALGVRLLGQPALHLHRRRGLLDDSQPSRADPAGSDHRHLLRGRIGGGDSRHEQVDVGKRAPERHARRQHPRRVVAGSREDGDPLRRGRPVPLHLPRASFSRSRSIRRRPRPRASRSGCGIFSSTRRSASSSPRRCRLPACCWCSAT